MTERPEPGGNIMHFDREKLTVIVVPKAACSSIKRTLARYYDSETHREQVEQMKVELGGSHDRWRYALRALRVPSDERRSYFKIAIVRSPWARARSMYADKCIQRTRPNPRLRALGFFNKMPWRAFVKLIYRIRDEEAEKHIKSQYLTTHLLGPPDVLIRFEGLENGWRMIQGLFLERGGQSLPTLPLMNDTRRVLKPAWTQRLAALIAERYNEDVELLNYQEANPCR